MLRVSKIFKPIGILLLLAILIAIYYFFDPAKGRYFPPCPFHYLTGYKCPGCGSQRAIHELLHFDLKAAFGYNQLLVISIPYLLVGFLFDYAGLKEKYPEARKLLFGKTAIVIVFLLVISFWLLRNIL